VSETTLNVAVVGATGAVGQEFLRLFAERHFPVKELRLLASARSLGKSFSFQGQEIPVQKLAANSFEGIDVAFFSAGASRSREFAPHAIAAGALVVDNSSAFRMDPSVPLVVPEVNAETFSSSDRLVAVPNCSAIILVTAIHPLRQLGTFDRVIVSTYQSASGGGAAMMARLLDETRDYLATLQGAEPTEFPPANHPPYAFNLFSHNTAIGDNGLNEEENKMVEESRKILGLPNLKMSPTCVRVPVLRAHTESVTVEFAEVAPSIDEIRSVLSAAPGVTIVDDRSSNNFPTPRLASGQGDVLVGRLRQDPSNPKAICMLISGDQLLKGAALNAVQIAELRIPTLH
jgi:aspartate-semialdehyde dehydrogenase